MSDPKEKQKVEEKEKSPDDGKPTYYYDDAHGYEEYDPERDVEAEDDDDSED